MSYSGIFMRQFMGETPGQTGSGWQFSPDVIVYGTGLAPDPNVFTTADGYAKTYSRPPVIGQANTIYVRGINTKEAAQTSRVYLYAVENVDLLKPGKWKSNAFTVNGAAQNWVDITAQTTGQIVVGSAPLVWTPAVPATGNTYVLLAWIDNSAAPQPPPFSTLPDFDYPISLQKYVQEHPEMTVWDTAYKGIFMRQYLGQRPNQTGTSWMYSPDIEVYGTAEAMDSDQFKDSEGYNWLFSQAPAFGKANYVYARGINATAGVQKSRVYFYYVSNDLALDPKNWKSDALTVGGVAQNYVDFSATSKGQKVIGSKPLLWTPPAPGQAGGYYYVISWVDNSPIPAPPRFSDLPVFGSLDALGGYVRSNVNMSFLDTRYTGLFLRQFSGQTPTQQGNGTQSSPDIIISPSLAMQDISALTSPAEYSSATVRRNATQQQRNFVYLRALNAAAAAQTARAYLYAARPTSISPSSWSTDSFTVAGKRQNWVDLTATAGGQILATPVPIVWNVDIPPADSPYILLVVYLDNSSAPKPPDFSPFTYVSIEPITQWIATQPRMSWLSVTVSAGTTPNMSDNHPLARTTEVVDQFVGLQFVNMPTDGTVSVSIPGPDAANTIVKATVRIPEPDATVVWPAKYPANFETSIAVNFWQGATSPPKGANILPIVLKKA